MKRFRVLLLGSGGVGGCLYLSVVGVGRACVPSVVDIL